MITHGFPIQTASLLALLLLGRGRQPRFDSRRLCLREQHRCFSFKAPLLFPLIGSAPSCIHTPPIIFDATHPNATKPATKTCPDKIPNHPVSATNNAPTALSITRLALCARPRPKNAPLPPRQTGPPARKKTNKPPLPPCKPAPRPPKATHTLPRTISHRPATQPCPAPPENRDPRPPLCCPTRSAHTQGCTFQHSPCSHYAGSNSTRTPLPTRTLRCPPARYAAQPQTPRNDSFLLFRCCWCCCW